MAFARRYLSCIRLVAMLVGGLGLTIVAQAQSQPPAADLVSLQFTVFSLQRVQRLYYQPAPASTFIPLEFFTQSRSVLCAYRGSRFMPFYEDGRTIVAGDHDMPSAVAIATIPPGVTRALLLFSPLPKTAQDGRKYAVYVVDDSSERLPTGHVAFLNAAGRSYMADVAGRRLTLPPGSSEPVPATGHLHVKLASIFKERWVRAGAHEFVMNERSRAWLVLFPPASPTGVAPQLRVLIDELPVEKRKRAP